MIFDDIPFIIVSITGSCGRGLVLMQESGSSIFLKTTITRKNAADFSVADLTIPGYIRTVSHDAFSNSNVICRLTLPKSLRVLGANAFQNCTALEYVVMTGSLYTFETGVFARCGKLREVSLPDGITEIPADTFREDYRLERVSLPDDSAVVSIRNDAFWGCKALCDFSIPKRVCLIEDRAFYRCRNLTCLTFPDVLISIGEEALFGSGLSSLVLPESLRIIKDRAFFRCHGLSEVTIPSGVSYIGAGAFHGCNRLKTLTILHDPHFIGPEIANLVTVIRCRKGSYADAYCKKYGYTAEYIDT